MRGTSPRLTNILHELRGFREGGMMARASDAATRMTGTRPRRLDAIARAIPIVGWLPAYEHRWLRADVIAGLTLWASWCPKRSPTR